MPVREQINIFWFRRDLRLIDNHALYHALKQKLPVLPIFIFDDYFFQQFGSSDKRFSLIYNQLLQLHSQLVKYQSGTMVFRGKPREIFEMLVHQYNIVSVYCNIDYEPYSIKRDNEIKEMLTQKNIKWNTYHDHVIFPPEAILKNDHSPYTIFTPYKTKWLSMLSPAHYQEYPSEKLASNFMKFTVATFPSCQQLEIHYQSYILKSISLDNIIEYEKYRDFPGMDRTTHASVHLRYGLISKRALVRKAIELNNVVYLSELIWHDFFNQILYHFPQVEKNNFNQRFNHLVWHNNEKDFERWCQGKTGYPIVDAGINELISTGYMHNRVRMITASFLCKHLLIDWRWGELFFAQHLMDYDLAQNNGNWQWSAGTGCDAAPFFRIFNPITQQQRFDPKNEYIQKWLNKNHESLLPIITHKEARERALAWYKNIVSPNDK